MSPGPANLAVASVAMRSGRRSGMLFGAGLSAGLAFWGLVAATGLGALLQGSAHGLAALKIGGGLYLLWLACQSGRSALKGPRVGFDAPQDGAWFWRGAVLNLSNPKAVVAWMAALSMGLGAGDDAAQVIAATLVCMGLGVVNYAGHAMAFSVSGAMAGYRRYRRRVEGIAAGLFAMAGLGLVRSAFSR